MLLSSFLSSFYLYLSLSGKMFSERLLLQGVRGGLVRVWRIKKGKKKREFIFVHQTAITTTAETGPSPNPITIKSFNSSSPRASFPSTLHAIHHRERKKTRIISQRIFSKHSHRSAFKRSTYGRRIINNFFSFASIDRSSVHSFLLLSRQFSPFPQNTTKNTNTHSTS